MFTELPMHSVDDSDVALETYETDIDNSEDEEDDE